MKAASCTDLCSRVSISIVALAIFFSGCIGPEKPLPPEEALSEAAARIHRILEQEPIAAARPIEQDSTKAPGALSSIRFWYAAHPVLGRALSQPESRRLVDERLGETRLDAQFIGEWPYAVQKLTVSLAADDLPDAALVARGWLPRLALSGRIIPLDMVLPDELLRDLRPSARAALSMDGHLYAVPADGFCLVLLYNRELLQEPPPQTWEELRTWALSVDWPSEAKGQKHAIGALPFLPALWSAGGEVVRDGSCALDSAEARRALGFLLALRDEGLMHPQAIENTEYGLALFLRGDVAMTVASSEALGRVRSASFPVGIAAVPGERAPISAGAEYAVVIFARHAAAKREGLVRLVDALTGPEVQGRDAALMGSAPVRLSVAAKADTLPGLDRAYDSMRATPLVPAWGSIEMEMYRYLDRAYRWVPGDVPAKQAH